jgi:hypothetical protein
VAKEPERDMLSRWSRIDGMQAQKAKEKEEDCDLKEKLDREFSLLAQSNALQSFLCPEKINALKSLLAKGSTSGGGIDVSSLKTGDKSNEEKVKIDPISGFQLGTNDPKLLQDLVYVKPEIKACGLNTPELSLFCGYIEKATLVFFVS